MEDMYYVINTGESCTVECMELCELETRLEEKHYGDNEMLKTIPKDGDLNYWGDSLLIIKGSILLPSIVKKAERDVLIAEWHKLDDEHKRFIMRVSTGNGGKYAAEPLYSIKEEGSDVVKYWEIAEESGFVIDNGSYKWLITDKFNQMQKALFGVE